MAKRRSPRFLRRSSRLERLIVAELNQQTAPDDLTLDDLIKEAEEMEKDVITID